VKRKSATLNLVGFSPFTCPNTPAPAPNTPITRYLQYRVNCSSAQVGCVIPIQKSATTTYTIDPFTGLQCVSGDVSVGCGCVNGSNESFTCSPTSQTTNCGPATITEGCTDQADAQGNNTITLSLLQSYTINDVVTKVDSMLSGNPLDDVMKFPAWNSDAQIFAGTGGSTAVSWQPVSACSTLSTLYYKSEYSVTKSELKLEFLGKTKVKVFFTSQDGGAATLESTTEYNKDQSVTISPPSQPGVRTLELVSEGSSDFSTFSSSVTPVTTGQRVSKVRNPAPEGEAPFAGFIGPDCKRYAVMTTENSASTNKTLTTSVIARPFPGANLEGFDMTETRDDNYSTTITTDINGTNSVSSGSGSLSYTFNSVDNFFGASDYTSDSTLAADGTLTTISTYTDRGQGQPSSYTETSEGFYTVGTVAALCDRTTTTGTSEPFERSSQILLPATATTTEKLTVSGSSSASSFETTSSGSDSSTYNENGEESSSSYSVNATRTSTSTTTWSGDMANTLTPANSTTTSWASNGGLCSWKSESLDGDGAESQSLTANFNVSVTVPSVSEPTSPTNYKTFVHWFVVTNDSSNPNCPTRSVMAGNRTKFNYVRGPFSLTESETLPNDLHVTHCITNMAASTEVQL
jgi:hypothetical protein